jgi:hypothetical protein
MMKEFRVKVFQVTEAGHTQWVADSKDVYGLNLARDSFDTLISDCKEVVPELIRNNHNITFAYRVVFDIDNLVLLKEVA